MKLQELLDSRLIQCQQVLSSKKALLLQLSSLFSAALSIPDAKLIIFDAFVEREKLGSTALGHGVAIPHIRTNLYKKPVLAVITLEKGVDFGAEDHRPVDIIFALIAPTECSNEHLQLLAECSALLVSNRFRESIRAINSAENIIHLITNTQNHVEPA